MCFIRMALLLYHICFRLLAFKDGRHFACPLGVSLMFFIGYFNPSNFV